MLRGYEVQTGAIKKLENKNMGTFPGSFCKNNDETGVADSHPIFFDKSRRKNS
jgi:hypothetical protein